MKKISIILILLLSANLYSQQKFTISGYVQEESSGENLIGVTIYDSKNRQGTSTNQYGFYSLTLDKGEYEINYSFIGMKTISKKINLNNLEIFKNFITLTTFPGKIWLSIHFQAFKLWVKKVNLYNVPKEQKVKHSKAKIID